MKQVMSMREKYYLFYDTIPSWFMFSKKNTILKIELSGIQSFIFGSIDSYSSVFGVSRKSEYVQWLTKAIEKKLSFCFGEKNYYPVQSSSGNLIGAVKKKISVTAIDSVVKEIQLEIYKATDGQLEMFYGFCEAVVHKYDDHLYAGSNVLLRLGLAVSYQKYHCINTLRINEKPVDEAGFSFEKMQASEETDKRSYGNRRIVALKFDLDNLGVFFRGIHTVDRSRLVSRALDSVLKKSFADESTASVIFVGGDDIFAIAELENYLGVITRVRSRILNEITENPYLNLYKDYVGISGSVTEIRNDLGRVPLLYYYNEGEEMLEKAKMVPGKNSVAMKSGRRVITLQWNQIVVLNQLYTQHFREIPPEGRKGMLLNMIRMRDALGKYCTQEEWNVIKSIGQGE